jgi:hypothetical protein
LKKLPHFKTQIIKSLWLIKRLDNARSSGAGCLVLPITNNTLSDIKAISVNSELFACNGGDKPMLGRRPASLWTEERFQDNLILERVESHLKNESLINWFQLPEVHLPI